MRKFLIACILLIALPAQAAEKESAYERVMRTGVTKCGYVVWPPLFNKDPNTGVFSGIFYDYMNAAAASLNLKAEWAAEVTPANYIEEIKAGRIDALCSGDWAPASRAPYLEFTTPIFYIAIVLFTREGETRFDGKKDAINSENVKISVIDGEVSDLVTRKEFPKAQTLALPQSSDPTMMLMNVADGKADIALTDVPTGTKFMAANPGKIRMVSLQKPVRVFANTLSIQQGEVKLRSMLDTATREMLQSGEIEPILKKYEEFPGSLYRVAPTYEMPQ